MVAHKYHRKDRRRRRRRRPRVGIGCFFFFFWLQKFLDQTLQNHIHRLVATVVQEE